MRASAGAMRPNHIGDPAWCTMVRGKPCFPCPGYRKPRGAWILVHTEKAGARSPAFCT